MSIQIGERGYANMSLNSSLSVRLHVIKVPSRAGNPGTVHVQARTVLHLETNTAVHDEGGDTFITRKEWLYFYFYSYELKTRRSAGIFQTPDI